MWFHCMCLPNHSPRYTGTVCLAVFLAGLIELSFSTASESEEEDEIANMVNQLLDTLRLADSQPAELQQLVNKLWSYDSNFDSTF